MISLDKQNKILKILTSNIEVTSYNPSITFIDSTIDSTIKTTQTYNSSLDCDMSDFACGFYQILYKDILKEETTLVNDCGSLTNEIFAGDTMNSFNTIANRVQEAGKSTAQRTQIEKWPAYLKEYKSDYHCLANFWLIPMELGRTYKKYSKARTSKDYMDRFLRLIKSDWKGYKEKYPEYFSVFENYDDFLVKHFLKDIYVEDGEICEFSSSKSNPEDVIKNIQIKINARAEAISKSQYADKLWEYFDSIGLLKN